MTCDDLPFIHTTQKTLKPSKKLFQFPGKTRKNFTPGNFSWSASAETWDASCFKKALLEKQQSVPNTCNISPLKNIIFQKRCIFQISLQYKKLVIPKILFILVLCNFTFFQKSFDTPKILFIMVLCNFNFFFKIMWPPAI